MECKNVITIIPDGCLDKEKIDLRCKSPIEVLFYQFSLADRMQSNDAIIHVDGQSCDPSIIIDQVTCTGLTFKCRIGGGQLNMRVGIRFVITTELGETLEFVCVLSIMPQGILGQNQCGSGGFVLGATGPAGKSGDKGDKGDTGEQGLPGEKGEQGVQGENYVNDGTVDLNVKTLQLGSKEEIVDLNNLPLNTLAFSKDGIFYKVNSMTYKDGSGNDVAIKYWDKLPYVTLTDLTNSLSKYVLKSSAPYQILTTEGAGNETTYLTERTIKPAEVKVTLSGDKKTFSITSLATSLDTSTCLIWDKTGQYLLPGQTIEIGAVGYFWSLTGRSLRVAISHVSDGSPEQFTYLYRTVGQVS